MDVAPPALVALSIIMDVTVCKHLHAQFGVPCRLCRKFGAGIVTRDRLTRRKLHRQCDEIQQKLVQTGDCSRASHGHVDLSVRPGR